MRVLAKDLDEIYALFLELLKFLKERHTLIISELRRVCPKLRRSAQRALINDTISSTR